MEEFPPQPLCQVYDCGLTALLAGEASQETGSNFLLF